MLLKLGLVLGGLVGLAIALQAPTPTAADCEGAVSECVGKGVVDAALPFVGKAMGGAMLGLLFALLIVQSLPGLRAPRARSRE